jgi:hypothetical protein
MSFQRDPLMCFFFRKKKRKNESFFVRYLVHALKRNIEEMKETFLFRVRERWLLYHLSAYNYYECLDFFLFQLFFMLKLI